MPKKLMNGVRSYREMKRMTQEDLAKIVGVSRQTIVAIEKGNYTPSVALAMELAKVLGCTVEKLFYWK